MVVAVLFHGKEWNSKRIKVVDKFIEELKKLGVVPTLYLQILF